MTTWKRVAGSSRSRACRLRARAATSRLSCAGARARVRVPARGPATPGARHVRPGWRPRSVRPLRARLRRPARGRRASVHTGSSGSHPSHPRRRLHPRAESRAAPPAPEPAVRAPGQCVMAPSAVAGSRRSPPPRLPPASPRDLTAPVRADSRRPLWVRERRSPPWPRARRRWDGALRRPCRR